MSERERDEHSGVETTGHDWDGIKELDNPLPRWWLWVFYGSIAVAVVYWVMMPAWPGLRGYTPGLMKQSDRVDLVEQLDALQAQRGRGEAMLMSASLEQIENAEADLQAQVDPYASETSDLRRRYGPRVAQGDFDGDPARLTKMDALIAYLQQLGTMVDFRTYKAEDPDNMR